MLWRLARENALAYLSGASVRDQKSFYNLDPRMILTALALTPTLGHVLGDLARVLQNTWPVTIWFQSHKTFFSASLMLRKNNLECLSLASFFPASLIFASKGCSLCKYYTCRKKTRQGQTLLFNFPQHQWRRKKSFITLKPGRDVLLLQQQQWNDSEWLLEWFELWYWWHH